MIQRVMTAILVVIAVSFAAYAQVDSTEAQSYFQEAQTLCEREGGRLWGVSLCGPMVIADATTNTIATSQPAPPGDRPAALGFANAPMNWGGRPWSAYMWQNFPNSDAQSRGRLLIHELFHRVQPDLKLMAQAGPNDHLDTLAGRYWLQLEWRALSRAVGGSAEARAGALRDALAFRQKRRSIYPAAAAAERADEIREGLAQYTGVVVAAPNRTEAIADAVNLLAQAEKDPTFVRTFAYASGPAYGLLLDEASPGWTRRVTATDDLGLLLMAAAGITPGEDADGAAERYGGQQLRNAEEKLDAERQARIDGLRRKFVENSVIIAPRPKSSTVNNRGATPIPNEGTVILGFRATTDWGSIEVTNGVLITAEGDTIRLATPFRADGAMLSGDGWTVKLAPGWVLRPASRAGDLQIIRD